MIRANVCNKCRAPIDVCNCYGTPVRAQDDAIITRLRPYLPKVAEILDLVKQEWGDSWTEWAQGIRAETTALMLLTETDPAIRATFDQARGKQ